MRRVPRPGLRERIRRDGVLEHAGSEAAPAGVGDADDAARSDRRAARAGSPRPARPARCRDRQVTCASAVAGRSAPGVLRRHDPGSAHLAPPACRAPGRASGSACRLPGPSRCAIEATRSGSSPQLAPEIESAAASRASPQRPVLTPPCRVVNRALPVGGAGQPAEGDAASASGFGHRAPAASVRLSPSPAPPARRDAHRTPGRGVRPAAARSTGSRAVHRQHLAARRMLAGDSRQACKRLALEAADGLAAVGPVPHQRMADAGQVDADLVGAPGAQPAGQRSVGLAGAAGAARASTW